MDSSGDLEARCIQCGKTVIYIGIAEALVFMVLKIALGLSCGSRALVAASLYSIQDLGSSVVAGVGMSISARPADRCHPYGHGKVEYLVVVLMCLMILLGIIALAVTSLASFFIHAGDAPPPAPPTMLALWVALVCGTACWLLSGRQECAGGRLNSPALKSCAAHMHSDCVASAAVVVSVIGAKLGYPALDHVVAIVEAAHVVFVSGRMLGSALSGLMDTAAEPELVERLRRVIGEVAARSFKTAPPDGALPGGGPLDAGRLESVACVGFAAARWSGQTLLAQVDVEVPGNIDVTEADTLRERLGEAVKTRVCGRSETLVRVLPRKATADAQLQRQPPIDADTRR